MKLIYFHVFFSLSHVIAGSQGQFPVTQNVTVVEGSTANMTCRVDYNDNTSLQWSNPAQQTLFFGDKKGQCDWVSLKAFVLKTFMESVPFGVER